MARATPQDVGENLVSRGDAGARVDHEHAHVDHLDRALGQAAHAALQAVIGDVFQPRRVDHREPDVAQLGLALAQVPRDARLIVDQRQAFADQAVEQCGFADIGAAHKGKGEAHHGLRASADTGAVKAPT